MVSTIPTQQAASLTAVSGRRCLLATQMREHGFSGGQIHALAVRDLLASAGWCAKIVTPFHGHSPLRPAAFALRYSLRSLSRQAAIYWLREGHNWYLRRALGHALQRGREGAILYAQDPLSAQSALAVRRPGLDKVVLVIHFNDSQASEWAMRGEILEHGWAYRRMDALERAVLPRVDALIYVSQYMQQRIEARIPAAKAVRSAVIPNFVAASTPAPDAHRGDILSIGTLEPRKNQAYILRVLGELHRRGLRLTATFLGGGGDRGALEKLARELELTPFVYFGGNVRDAAGWLSTHRVLVHASLLENCPIALIEALAAGVPVVAAPVGGVPELVDEKTGAVWDLHSVDAGADQLQALLTDEARMQSARELARARYKQRFSPESAGSSLAELFAQLLDGERSPQ